MGVNCRVVSPKGPYDTALLFNVHVLYSSKRNPLGGTEIEDSFVAM